MRDDFIADVTIAMRQDPRIFYLVADFGSPKLDVLTREFPDRFINVGIAEQNLINLTAGLALEGFKVFAYAIAPFLTMRCYEQIRVSLAMLSSVRPMNVTLVGVGAGFSYDVSGPTHQMLEDISIMRTLPNIQIGSPSDGVSARAFVTYCLQIPGVKYLRLDGKALPDIYSKERSPDLQHGFSVLRQGRDAVIIATGYMTHKALAAANTLATQGVEVGVIDMLLLKPIDETHLVDTLRKYRNVLTVEEGFAGKGGVDSMVLHLLSKHRLPARFEGLGIADRYGFAVGAREELLEDAGLEERQIVAAAKRLLRENS